MLHCAECGTRLTGDTGYYRHRSPCPSFVAARPELPRRRGRTHGMAYRREWYEDAVGRILDEASVNAGLLTSVVAEVGNPASRPDRATLARVHRERDLAAARYVHDRDLEALTRAMERLDVEERAAETPHVVEGVPADKAVEYLRELGATWDAADGGPGRRMVAQALFERIDATGFREVAIHLTDHAIAHGFQTVLPERFGISVSGRGERI